MQKTGQKQTENELNLQTTHRDRCQAKRDYHSYLSFIIGSLDAIFHTENTAILINRFGLIAENNSFIESSTFQFSL